MTKFEILMEKFENSTFCFAKEGGEGFVEQEKCACVGNKSCQAFLDQERFHQRFLELSCEYGDRKRRNQVIETIKPEFEHSEWWKHNVQE